MNDDVQISSGNHDLAGNLDDAEMTVIPVIHENVAVNKQLVETGKVKISKKVVEEHQTVTTPLVHEVIDIQTIELNQYLDSYPDPVRYEGDTMIIPVIKEVVIVRILLEKEIRVTKKKIQTEHVQDVILKKEEVIIEHTRINDTNQNLSS